MIMCIYLSKLTNKFVNLHIDMKKIDRETVQKILDAADIVDVVSDFVSLKRRGANYIGLCPFHSERTPSFSVSKSKGICKCFSCGKGGSPVNFLMELEQFSFNEALRYLARKYNIEIKEHEMTDAEREASSEREAIIAINDFALNHFEHNLLDTQEGNEIGLAYFRERGISDASIRKFRLGYAIDRPDNLSNAAIEKGFNEKYLITAGLCSKTEKGTLYDRFKGRVIYPVFGVSGKIVAFGGRTLRKDKNIAKYVNSPETAVYRKSYELYGLYQAKGPIVKKDKCILVEGYMDVISMSQIGIENVVASSGTSLTDGQIRLIHRFTNNVTVIYDSDPAGIKASLRGIDMLLAEGMDIKVLLLPEGDDPDSFAQSHSGTEVEEYIVANETDFIRFKTSILLKDAANDPIRRANVISDILRSIAVIPDAVKRQVYIQECSRMLTMDEKVLSLQLSKTIADNAEKSYINKQREAARESIRDLDSLANGDTHSEIPTTHTHNTNSVEANDSTSTVRNHKLLLHEQEIIRYILKYGCYTFCDVPDENGIPQPITVLQFFNDEFVREGLKFSSAVHTTIFNRAIELYMESWPKAKTINDENILQTIEKARQQGIDNIRQSAKDIADISARELVLQQDLEDLKQKLTDDFSTQFLLQYFINDPDDDIRRLSTDLVSEKHQLSKVHTKYAHIETEQDKLSELCPRAFYELMDATLACDIADIMSAIATAQTNGDIDSQMSLISSLIEKKNIAADFAHYLGDRVVTPHRRI